MATKQTITDVIQRLRNARLERNSRRCKNDVVFICMTSKHRVIRLHIYLHREEKDLRTDNGVRSKGVHPLYGALSWRQLDPIKLA